MEFKNQNKISLYYRASGGGWGSKSKKKIKRKKILFSLSSIFEGPILSFFICKTEMLIITLVQMVPDLLWFDLWFFNFTMVQKWYTFSRNCSSNFEFWSFPRLTIHGMILSRDVAGSSEPHNHHGKQPILWEPFCTHTTILFFSFSTYSISYMRYSILDYKLCFVLDNFAQL